MVKPFLDGGTGPFVAGWVFPRACKAQWLARVDISRDRGWLFLLKTRCVMHVAIQPTYGCTGGWKNLVARWSASKVIMMNTNSMLTHADTAPIRVRFGGNTGVRTRQPSA